jgi:hypothetical protein
VLDIRSKPSPKGAFALKKTIISLMTAAAVAAVPVAAPAAPGPGSGGSGGEIKQRKSSRCKKVKRVGFVVQGALAAYDATTATLTVRKANQHARRWLAVPNPPTFDVASARKKFAGIADGNGTGVGFDDVLPTDRVRVIGKLLVVKRGCEQALTQSPLSIRKVQVTRPKPSA